MFNTANNLDRIREQLVEKDYLADKRLLTKLMEAAINFVAGIAAVGVNLPEEDGNEKVNVAPSPDGGA